MFFFHPHFGHGVMVDVDLWDSTDLQRIQPIFSFTHGFFVCFVYLGVLENRKRLRLLQTLSFPYFNFLLTLTCMIFGASDLDHLGIINIQHFSKIQFSSYPRSSKRIILDFGEQKWIISGSSSSQKPSKIHE